MTRTKTLLLVAALIVIAAAAGGLVGAGAAIALVKSSYNGPVNIERLSEMTVHSDELGESLVLRLHLPVEYALERERRFPVVWVLDGPSQGADVHRAMQTLSRIGAVESAIVVEVPRSSSGRSDDFTPSWEGLSGSGRADHFMRFLEREAIPSVEEAYRTDADRTVVGHSLGGLFALYALAERPALFDAYFAFSPSVWVGGEVIIRMLERSLQEAASEQTFLFVSVGAREGNEMAAGFDAVRQALETYAPPSLRWQAAVTAGADHGSNPILSYPVAASEYWRP